MHQHVQFINSFHHMLSVCDCVFLDFEKLFVDSFFIFFVWNTYTRSLACVCNQYINDMQLLYYSVDVFDRFFLLFDSNDWCCFGGHLICYMLVLIPIFFTPSLSLSSRSLASLFCTYLAIRSKKKQLKPNIPPLNRNTITKTKSKPKTKN